MVETQKVVGGAAMICHIFRYVISDLLRGPTPKAPMHVTSNLRVEFSVNADLKGMDLTAYFGSFGLATNVGLVFVRKLVVDSVIEVQIVELLILPIYLTHSLPELNCAPVLQQRFYVIKIC